MRRKPRPVRVYLESEARVILDEGADLIASAVERTLGPLGGTVVFSGQGGPPTPTKDGATVARRFAPMGRSRAGAALMRAVGDRTARSAGDGTTTATAFARALLRRCRVLLGAGVSPTDVVAAISRLETETQDALRLEVLPCTDVHTLRAVALRAANGEEALAYAVADLVAELGPDAEILIEEGRGVAPVTATAVPGWGWDRGMQTPAFAGPGGTWSADPCYVLLTQSPIHDWRELLPAVEIAAERRVPLLVVATGYYPRPVEFLLRNSQEQKVSVCAARAPGFGRVTLDLLDDLAYFVGAKVFGRERGLPLEALQEHDLGTAQRVTVTEHRTVIVDGGGPLEEVAGRVRQLRGELLELEDPFAAERVADRIAKLTGGSGVLAIGGYSDAERAERMARADDVVAACTCAASGGVVAGGVAALVRATDKAGNIASTAGRDVWELLHGPGISVPPFPFARDALTREVVSPLEVGLVDPAMVVEHAVRNACSVVRMLVSAGALIVQQGRT